MADLRLPAAAARRLCVEALAQVGVPAAEAECVADTLADASLRGADSHGLALLPTYVERIRSGQIRPGRCWVVRRETAGAALCDGQQGLGPVLACAAADLAAAKAARAGLAAVVLRDGNYVGALGYYVRRAAARGLFALAAANATPRVAPHGGRTGLHGTNPIAWAAPRAGSEPLVFDAATAYAAARVSRARDEGEELPPGIALDAAGAPTQDPAAAAVLLPVGGAFGYGLGLFVDLFTGALAGGPVGPRVPAVSQVAGPYGCSFTLLALQPGAFAGAAAFAAAAAELTAAARHCPPAAGFPGPVRLPGDRGAACRAERLASGIPVSAPSWRRLAERLAAGGVTVPEGLAPDG